MIATTSTSCSARISPSPDRPTIASTADASDTQWRDSGRFAAAWRIPLCTMRAMSSAARSETDRIEDNNCQLSAQVKATEEMVRAKLRVEPTGHDWWHAERVRRNALRIAEQEGANLLIVELAALLHDIADYKFTGSDETGPQLAAEWLLSIGVDSGVAAAVAEIIRWMSFRGAKVDTPRLSLEGQCVQDADRLDAIGAIGVARTFAYGGYV